MTERPITFSPPELRAERRAGRTQIRRPMRRQPPMGALARLIAGSITAEVVTPGRPDGTGGHTLSQTHWSEHCPFGRDGDRLWVREPWRVIADGGTPEPGHDTDCTIGYVVDGATQTFATGQRLYSALPRRRSPAHLPRWAARTVYEILDVSVQRLHQMTEQEAAAEGADPLDYRVPRALDAFRYFWEDSGHGPWDANIWIWVAHVRRLEPVR